MKTSDEKEGYLIEKKMPMLNYYDNIIGNGAFACYKQHSIFFDDFNIDCQLPGAKRCLC